MGLKATVFSVYTVHCRVIVDNKCEFQHSSSHGDCNFDARLVSNYGKTNNISSLRFRQDDLRSPTQLRRNYLRHAIPTMRSQIEEQDFDARLGTNWETTLGNNRGKKCWEQHGNQHWEALMANIIYFPTAGCMEGMGFL